MKLGQGEREREREGTKRHQVTAGAGPHGNISYGLTLVREHIHMTGYQFCRCFFISAPMTDLSLGSSLTLTQII